MPQLINLCRQLYPIIINLAHSGHGVVNVRPRIWWTRAPDGLVFTEVRYNKVALNIAGRGTSIEVGPLRKLPTVYRTVVKAVKAGELDKAIDNAARKSRPGRS